MKEMNVKKALTEFCVGGLKLTSPKKSHESKASFLKADYKSPHFQLYFFPGQKLQKALRRQLPPRHLVKRGFLKISPLACT